MLKERSELKSIQRVVDTKCCDSQTTTIDSYCSNPMPYKSLVSSKALKERGCPNISPCEFGSIPEHLCSDTVAVSWGVSPSNLCIDDARRSRPDRQQTTTVKINPNLGVKPDLKNRVTENWNRSLEGLDEHTPGSRNGCGDGSSNPTCWTGNDPRLRNPDGSRLVLDRPPLTGRVELRNVYSDRLSHHQTGFYRGYDDIHAGQIGYYMSSMRDSIFNSPNFTIRSNTVTELYRDPNGTVTTQHKREPLTKCSLYVMADCMNGSSYDNVQEISERENYMSGFVDQLSKNDYQNVNKTSCLKTEVDPLAGICVA